jgi:IS5 family transposase
MVLEEHDDAIGIDWSWLSMDGSMVKSPLGSEDTGPNPTDRGKKGTKRSILVDATGMPVRVLVTAGTVADCTVAPELLNGFTAEAVIADKGYDSQEIVEFIKHSGAEAVISPRRNRKQQ